MFLLLLLNNVMHPCKIKELINKNSYYIKYTFRPKLIHSNALLLSSQTESSILIAGSGKTFDNAYRYIHVSTKCLLYVSYL